MKALKIIGIIVAGLIVILVAAMFMLPSHSHLERSIVINASPQQVYSQLTTFKNFTSWSPWAKLDPNTKYEYSGPDTGIGASMSWVSEKDDVGSGKQTIIEAVENQHVKSEMYFGGFEKPSYADFILTPEGEGTKLTWTYDGDMEGFYKFFGLMMDTMLGPSYEQGLQSMKEMVEAMPAPVPADSTQVQ
jgi:uncharacterized protein YndB with AHSA1/START domain